MVGSEISAEHQFTASINIIFDTCLLLVSAEPIVANFIWGQSAAYFFQTSLNHMNVMLRSYHNCYSSTILKEILSNFVSR